MKTELLKHTKEHINRLSLIQPGDENIVLYGRKLSIDQIALMREWVLNVVECPTLLPPFKNLIDEDFFDTLDDEGKMRYLLEISSLFIYLKNTTKT